MIVTKDDIASAEARRVGEAAGADPFGWIAPGLPCLAAGALGVTAGVFLWLLSRPVPIGRIADIQSRLVQIASASTLFGVAALLSGAGGLLRLRRTRLFRAGWLIGAGGIGVLGGMSGLVLGGLAWLSAARCFGWNYTTMPAIDESVAASPLARTILNATVVLVAPDADGDARSAHIGVGAIIRREAGRAWIVTCSHVAMPYAAVATVRDPQTAAPVWVYLADGRNGPGRVTWAAEPPLDVAVVSFEIESPPEPVPVSERPDDVRPGDGVMVAVNPMRNGWILHHGSVSRRQPHATPAGPFSLLYTDLPLQPGDSGAGLFDAQGRLVGINTWATLDEARPAGISLPSNAMRSLLDVSTSGTSEGGG